MRHELNMVTNKPVTYKLITINGKPLLFVSNIDRTLNIPTKEELSNELSRVITRSIYEQTKILDGYHDLMTYQEIEEVD